MSGPESRGRFAYVVTGSAGIDLCQKESPKIGVPLLVRDLRSCGAGEADPTLLLCDVIVELIFHIGGKATKQTCNA